MGYYLTDETVEPTRETASIRGRAYEPKTAYTGFCCMGNINQYVFCANNPVNFRDPAGLWTFIIGGSAQGSLFVSFGVSVGVGFGHSAECGWSFGLLFSGGSGLAVTPNVSAGGFAQATNAKDLNKLKGSSGEFGGSAGEALVIGLDVVTGVGEGEYEGGELSIGVGGGIPIEAHGRVLKTAGPVWQQKKKVCP